MPHGIELLVVTSTHDTDHTCAGPPADVVSATAWKWIYVSILTLSAVTCSADEYIHGISEGEAGTQYRWTCSCYRSIQFDSRSA